MIRALVQRIGGVVLFFLIGLSLLQTLLLLPLSGVSASQVSSTALYGALSVDIYSLSLVHLRSRCAVLCPGDRGGRRRRYRTAHVSPAEALGQDRAPVPVRHRKHPGRCCRHLPLRRQGKGKQAWSSRVLLPHPDQR